VNILSNAERETHLNLVADDRGMWHVFSDDPVMIRRLDKIATATQIVGQGKQYKLQANQVILRKPPRKRTYTDDERQILAERMRNLRKQAGHQVLEAQNEEQE